MTSPSVKAPYLRLGPVSLKLNARVIAACLLTALLAFLLACLSVTLGDYPLALADVFRVLAGQGTAIEEAVVYDMRLGRAIVALCVGAALAYSGALTQSVARNPLASPDILGITNGAALAAAASIVFAGSTTLRIPVVAILGALLTGLAVVVLAGVRHASMIRMVLIGVAASLFLSALTSWLLVYADLDRAAEARLWLTGSLNGRDLAHGWPVLLAVLIAIALAGWLGHLLAALALGETTAHVLGVNVRAAQVVQLLTAAVLAAVAVAAAGPISFIAFVAPQIARGLGGTSTPPLFLSALTGALLLTAADFFARVIVPWELPVGVFTAFFGAPVLLYLIIRTNRKGSRA